MTALGRKAFKGHVDLVDDDDSLRESLADLLRFSGFEVRTWSHAGGLLDELPKKAPAIIVTDMRVPGLSGVELHKRLLAMGCELPVIYISGQSTVPQSVQAMKLGAVEFLVKPFSREEFLDAVVAALERDRKAMLTRIERRHFDEALKQLSPREREVTNLLMKGYNHAEVMQALGISLPTAKQYKSQILQKLGVRSLAQLIEFGRGLES